MKFKPGDVIRTKDRDKRYITGQIKGFSEAKATYFIYWSDRFQGVHKIEWVDKYFKLVSKLEKVLW